MGITLQATFQLLILSWLRKIGAIIQILVKRIDSRGKGGLLTLMIPKERLQVVSILVTFFNLRKKTVILITLVTMCQSLLMIKE